MKYFLLFSLTILSMFDNLTFANENGHHQKSDIKSETIQGQLVGLTCFVKHGSKGDEHKDCFKECAEKGLPIGVLTKNQGIYQISGEGHGDLRETNKKFLKYAEKEIIAKGKLFKSNGFNMIVVDAIKLAK